MNKQTHADLYEKAVKVATKAHQGQTRWGGEPYITHPLAVAEAFDLERQPREKIIAVLHDVLEDSDVTYKEIVGNFGVVIADAVRQLTHPPHISYADYVVNIRDETIAGNTSARLARVVKEADLRHNLSDLNDPKKHKQRRDKYELALALLAC